MATVCFCEHCNQPVPRYPYTWYCDVMGTVKYFCCANCWRLWHRAWSSARKELEDTWR